MVVRLFVMVVASLQNSVLLAHLRNIVSGVGVVDQVSVVLL